MKSDKIRPCSWVRRKTNWTTWRTIAVTKSVLANSHFSIFLVFYKCINWKLTKASQGIKKSWMIRKKRGKVNFEVFLLNSIDTGLEDLAWHEQMIHPVYFYEHNLDLLYFIFFVVKRKPSWSASAARWQRYHHGPHTRATCLQANGTWWVYAGWFILRNLTFLKAHFRPTNGQTPQHRPPVSLPALSPVDVIATGLLLYLLV